MPSQVKTFSAASSDIANFETVRIPKGTGATGNNSSGAQTVRIRAVFSAAGATATLAFAWAGNDGTRTTIDVGQTDYGVIGYVEVALAATARRQNFANNAGGYVGSVNVAASGADFMDTLGVGFQDIGPEALPQLTMGCTALSAGTVTIFLDWTNNI